MTIKRQYSLPNCKLILQGLSDTGGTNLSSGQVLSILMSAECHINGQAPPLTGGRDFFESLVRQVSSYAQEFLSGISYSRHHSDTQELLHLKKIDVNLHRLTLSDGNDSPGKDQKPERIIDLTTVELFDLVEAIDQFFADSLTLPDFSLAVGPVSRKQANSGEPMAQKVLPAAVGMSGLAIAALALFFVPIPEVQRPREPQPQSNESVGNLETTPTGTPEPGFNPTPTPESSDSSPKSTTIDSSEERLSEENLESSLTTSSEITNPTEIEKLQNLLSEKINDTWKTKINTDLMYRVTVAADGSIIGYKPISPAAADDVDKTPLPNLLDQEAVNGDDNQSTAEFRVLFTKQGSLEVEPW
ncbi:MAG: DUF4335 domain-containing protein [Okeania sp. SIO3I5]|uniref:DUF4335 domain-containing protein n=1 Tax=Okeania sp. SIO3I5 TaxID=2607805 RepID=UPI0013BBCE6B|nr:DUF4335 domain-containing protein [Okeania sp. SIO3I5]NEQ41361.1 DUF4335 domain-containing protein [Okeania sp. SIO3I5]